MTSRIFYKLLISFLLVIFAATLILDFTLRSAWEDSLVLHLKQQLTEKAQMFANRVESDHSRPLTEITTEDAKAAEARATVIESSGKVLADSQANPEEMENHATRPEFISALHGTPGSNIRRSHTVGIEFLYVAVPIKGGAVRLAYPLDNVRAMVGQVHKQLLIASAWSILVALLLAALVARAVSRRLERIVVFAERVAAGDYSARLADSASDEIAQVTFALDRTARKLQESFRTIEDGRRQFEAILNGMEDGVLAVTAQKNINWANRALYRIAGKVRVGANVVETLRDPELLRAVDESLGSQEPRTIKSVAVVPGKIFDVTVAPVSNGAICVLHDLTEIERVEKTRRDFIANVSHELRTPLTSIQGYAETLLDTTASGDANREFIEIIRKHAARMSRLTDDLLTLARVESGEQKMEFEAVAASELLKDAQRSFADHVQRRGMELKLGRTSEQIVSADRDAIHQVFSNLIENATKYASSGSVIELGAQESPEGIEFYVQDFGAGIPYEHLPRLFERFYRVDKARSTETGGTGLGLSIVKHIVLNHGGRVRVESVLNQGSTFCFTLPVATAVPSEAAKTT